MGMYSEIIDNKDLVVDEKLKEFDEPLYDFLLGRAVIRFYGYFDKAFLEDLNEYGREGLIKGKSVIKYEEGDYIVCKWSTKGFEFSAVFPEEIVEWVKEKVKI